MPYSIPSRPVPLVTNINEQQYPCTDHPLIIQQTLFGYFGTLNILAPGSTLAPVMAQHLSPTSAAASRIQLETLGVDVRERMQILAHYIYSAFEDGLQFLALQEIPATDSLAFKWLKAALQDLDKKAQLIEIGALQDQWTQTSPHSFGVSVLYRKDVFTITKSRVCLNERGQEYQVKAIKPGHEFLVSNIHGDYKAQRDTLLYVQKHKGICLGDSNISVSKKAFLSKGGVFLTAQNEVYLADGNVVELETLDIVSDSISSALDPAFIPTDKEFTSSPAPAQNVRPIPATSLRRTILQDMRLGALGGGFVAMEVGILLWGFSALPILSVMVVGIVGFLITGIAIGAIVHLVRERTKIEPIQFVQGSPLTIHSPLLEAYKKPQSRIGIEFFQPPPSIPAPRELSSAILERCRGKEFGFAEEIKWPTSYVTRGIGEGFTIMLVRDDVSALSFIIDSKKYYVQVDGKAQTLIPYIISNSVEGPTYTRIHSIPEDVKAIFPAILAALGAPPPRVSSEI